MSLVIIHSRLSISILLYVTILCIWSFLLFFRKRQIAGNYRGALAIAEILILVQGALGGFLYLSGLQPERGGMHILYGIVGALGIPAVYTFTKGNSDRKTALVYAATLLFIAGIFIRSIVTG